MRCIACDAGMVSERPELTACGYRRVRCRACGKQFNERSGGILNRVQYPSDVIALVVFWRLRYKLSLRDLPEMFLIRGSFLAAILADPAVKPLLSTEHFSVDGTLIEAWAARVHRLPQEA